jgi:PRTRC genetic system protein C
MTVTTLPRIFKFEEKELPDIDPSFTPEDVIEHYSSFYPELACGYVKSMQPEENRILYTIGLNIGSKA